MQLLPLNEGQVEQSSSPTAVTALRPQEVELQHSKVVVSWLLYFHVLFRNAPLLKGTFGVASPWRLGRGESGRVSHS